MKKFELVCVGKIKESYFREGIDEYLKRLSRFCDISVLEIPDRVDDNSAVELESRAILEKLNGYVILADLKGKMLTSEDFAQAIDKAYLSNPKIQFVIGGSRGVSDAVRQRANLSIAFGKLTFPHRLMRLIAAEQIYRAFSILAGSEYHK